MNASRHCSMIRVLLDVDSRQPCAPVGPFAHPMTLYLPAERYSVTSRSQDSQTSVPLSSVVAEA